MEVSALTNARAAPLLRGASPLLRLQSDERLIALTRRGQPAAFEVLCSRYQARLLAFCRHMLGSREDAEDVMQEVFTAAFNAVLADEREINVRPWLYRIARNRSLNHLRRASAVGVDSMDVHFADHGLSTGERVLRRETFRELLADVHQLPETQRTALLLREIDALSYEQIAHAMETTVPSVKSLLVRARISLAEAAEARKLSCAEVRMELGEVAEGLVKLSALARRHVRDCDRCRSFKKQLKENNHALAAILPVGPWLIFKKLLLVKIGSTASASSAHVAGGAGVTVSAGTAAGASAGAATGASAAGSVFTVGAGALATKAVAGLAAAAIVSAGAVAANDVVVHHHRHAHAASASVARVLPAAQPVIVAERAQPLSIGARRFAVGGPAHRPRAARAVHRAKSDGTNVKSPTSEATAPAPAPASPAAPAAPAAAPEVSGTQVTQVTTATTQLPSTGSPASAHEAPATAESGTPSAAAPSPAVQSPASAPPAPTPPPPAPSTSTPASSPSPPPSQSPSPASAPSPSTPATTPTPAGSPAGESQSQAGAGSTTARRADQPDAQEVTQDRDRSGLLALAKASFRTRVLLASSARRSARR